MNTAPAFTFEDVWLLTSLFTHGPEKAEVDLSAILAAGDYLNHAIFALRELRQGFEHLQAGGWVEIDGSELSLTEKAIKLREDVLRAEGGRFLLVERTFKSMNRVQTAQPGRSVAGVDSCDFLTAEKLLQAYLSYLGGTERQSGS